MASSPIPTAPIAILRWEHERLDARLNELSLSAPRLRDSEAASEFRRKLEQTLRMLDYHQETEDRFVYPLILSLDEPDFLKLKTEHESIFSRSDIIVSSTPLNDPDNLSRLIAALRSNLNDHFLDEERLVLSRAEESLTVAQLDILRIKFAARRPIVV